MGFRGTTGSSTSGTMACSRADAAANSGRGSSRSALIAHNAIRRANPALQTNERLVFHNVDNPNLLCYSKSTVDHSNTILVAINLDPAREQGGWIDLDLKALAVPHGEFFDVEDLLNGQQYTWHDRSNYVALRPDVMPAHVFRLKTRT